MFFSGKILFNFKKENKIVESISLNLSALSNILKNN